jgi:hypothetical protein
MTPSKLKTIPIFVLVGLIFISCQQRESGNKTTKGNMPITETATPTPRPLSSDFKEYWYSGKAEITSYTLEQARYGELREGHAVLVYVTEPFTPSTQLKADDPSKGSIPVLKLNATKKFLTGIYPYSIMTSSFQPVQGNGQAIKISNTVQEWCGHVYAQLNNRDRYEVVSHSYFESEGDRTFKLEKDHLEDGIWNKIRLDPGTLPTGNIKMIPSMEYTRLGHKELKVYEARATLSRTDTLSSYEISYPALERTLTIHFTSVFPHSIEGWSETFRSGFGPGAKLLTSTATKKKTLLTAYWQQNGNSDLFLRDSLGL